MLLFWVYYSAILLLWVYSLSYFFFLPYYSIQHWTYKHKYVPDFQDSLYSFSYFIIIGHILFSIELTNMYVLQISRFIIFLHIRYYFGHIILFSIELMNMCIYVRFEIFTAVTMKNSFFWDVAPCRSCLNRRFGGTYRHHLQGRKIRERETSVSRWLTRVIFSNLWNI
jgi:hypothetical protein